MYLISTHTLTWSVTKEWNTEKKDITDFNSHAHVERDLYNFKNANKCGNFNSHAHVERDIAVLRLVLITRISTHTLTWSVTITSIYRKFNY